MKRDTLYLNAESFTTMSACAREVVAILEYFGKKENQDGDVDEGDNDDSPPAYSGSFSNDRDYVERDSAGVTATAKIIIRANPKQREELESELEPIKQQWRVKVEEVA